MKNIHTKQSEVVQTQETEFNNEETNNGKLEIVYKLHGIRATRAVERFIDQKALPIRERYPDAEIRIEVDV